MSPSVYITVRTVRSGKRYVVRYRIGGRYSRLVHAGSFRTQKAARERRDFVIAEIAAGRNPRETLDALEQTAPAKTLQEWAVAYEPTRIDQADETRRGAAVHLKRILPTFGHRTPETITAAEIAEWVALQSLDLKASSLRPYLSTFRQLLDFADAAPNPARDKVVRLPKIDSEPPTPPTGSQIAAILSAVPDDIRDPLRVMDATGMRVGDVAGLWHSDVDVKTSRFRVRHGKTNAARRWVAVPRSLMDDLKVPDFGRLFPSFTPRRARTAMEKACADLGLPHFHPHDLRHRYASVQLREGVPIPKLSAQLGHTSKKLTLDTYAHVILGDESPAGEVPVRSENDD